MNDPNNLKNIDFIKMSALGNDFVIIDFRSYNYSLNQSIIKKICNRKNIGCDQLIIIKNSTQKNWVNTKNNKIENIECEIEIFNNDGSITEACGNATRCVAGLLFEENKFNHTINIKASTRILECKKISNQLISVNMGIVKFSNNFFFEDFNFYCADVGNPHAVSFINNSLDDKIFFRIGSTVENHNNFPNRTNVEFAQIIEDDLIEVRVWERGVGETMACGTGACAVVACAIKNKLINSNDVIVKFPGGKLQIQYLDHEAIMIGTYQKIFNGIIDEKLFL